MNIKIAFMGIRGVPANYSGFETFAEQLGSRLAIKNFSVFVYNRSHLYNNSIKEKYNKYKGMKLIFLPSIPLKHFETISHTFLSILHSFIHKYDIIYICGVGNSIICWLPRLFGTKVIINVDGKDWERDKWKWFAKKFLKFSEKLAIKFANVVITDSENMRNYYKSEYNADTVYIPYGGDLQPDYDNEFLIEYNLEPKKYILFVGRLEPENNAHIVIEAFKKISFNHNFGLVIIGDAPYADEYKAYLKELAGSASNIIFTGFLFGKGYRQISTNCYLFILSSEVGGTHPVLVEQMSLGNCIIASDTESNREVLQEAGCFFDLSVGSSDLQRKIEFLISNQEEANVLRIKAKERAKLYSWDAITEKYINLFNLLIRK